MKNNLFKTVARGFYWCLAISLITHIIILFYDSLKLEFTFEFSPAQQEKIKTIEKNAEKVASTMHRKEDKEMLVEHFEAEKEQLISEAKQEFLNKKEGNSDKEGEGKEGQSAGGNVAPNFGGFVSKNKEEMEVKKKRSEPISLTYLGNKSPTVISAAEKCNGQVYVGLGLQLGNMMASVGNGGISEMTPWKVSHVAGGYVADRNEIKSGDVFLGIKDDKGQFWEGNTLIAKGLKAGAVVDAIFRQKDQVVSKKMVLEEICYEAKAQK